MPLNVWSLLSPTWHFGWPEVTDEPHPLAPLRNTEPASLSPPLMFRSLKNSVSPGALAILSLAIVASALVIWLPSEEPRGIHFWVYHKPYHDTYQPKIDEWNRNHPETPFAMSLFSHTTLERRTLSGFLSGTPLADLIALHSGIIPKTFLGPVEQIGLLDLTDRLHAEGLYEQFNEPSFSGVTSRGRIYALPRDVHPALLTYRADIVEEAGIDMSQIETWDDYFRILRPLMIDKDGDGRPDRYLLSLSETRPDVIAMLIHQNDGEIFDAQDHPVFASERNAETLSRIIPWITGPDRVTVNVPPGAAGNKQMLEALSVGIIASDVILGIWKQEIPQLAGKIKVMPLPAFERGGRRTSARAGNSMIGINKRSPYIEESWEMLKSLQTSVAAAEKIWREMTIFSPVKTLWSQPFYHEPDPFYCGQQIGSIYIEAAPNIPLRPSSPYAEMAYAAISNATIALCAYAEKHDIYDPEKLQPEALQLLQHQQVQLEKLISRNVFLD